MKFLTRGDKILIILILILSSLPLLTLRDSMAAGSKQIIVNIDGEVKHEFLLNEQDTIKIHSNKHNRNSNNVTTTNNYYTSKCDDK